MAKGLKDPRVKVVSGIRGSRKSIILHEIRDGVLSAGVKESHVAFIDFENALFRGFKTVEDVLRHLEKLPKTKNPVYVFLDEIGMVSWDAELLGRLAGDRRWNAWAATSSADVVYTPRDCDADFVTLDSQGKAKLWSIPKDPIHTPELFRPCVGGKL